MPTGPTATNGQRQQNTTTPTGPPAMQAPATNEYPSYTVYDHNQVMPPMHQPQTVAQPPPPKTARPGSKALAIIDPATGKSIFDKDNNKVTSSTSSGSSSSSSSNTINNNNNDVVVVVNEKVNDLNKEDHEKENAEPMTPVVSAMSDGPSVDITPKHTNKIKKTKPPEVIAPVVAPPVVIAATEPQIEVEEMKNEEIIDAENNNGNISENITVEIKSVSPPPSEPQQQQQQQPIVDVNDTNNNNYEKEESQSDEIPVKEESPIEVEEVIDETDRAAVMAIETPQDSLNNNEVESEKTPVVIEGPINYDDDQWSPANLAGKKYYTRDQLLKLKDAIAVPPVKLADGFAGLMKNNKEYLTNTLNQTMPPMGMRQPYDAISSVAPKFMPIQPGGRNPYPNKRPSQTGMKQQVGIYLINFFSFRN